MFCWQGTRIADVECRVGEVFLVRLEEIHKRVETVEKTNVARQKKFELLKETVQKLEKSNASLLQEVESLNGSLQNTVQTSVETVQELTGANATLRQEVESLKRSLQNNATQLEEVKSLKSSNEELQNTVQQLNANLVKTEQRNEELMRSLFPAIANANCAGVGCN